MSNQPRANLKYIYKFTLKAITDFYMGDRTQGEILKYANDTPYISGNSIGGALRECLVSCGRPEQEIIRFLGGEAGITDDDLNLVTKTFIKSKLYISDAIIKHASVLEKEGTKIDARFSSALAGNKYRFKYLPKGFTAIFSIECDIMPRLGEDGEGEHAALKELIKLWARAFENGDIRLGGKKSNNFGCFSVEKVQYVKYEFDTLNAVEEYILNRHEQEESNLREFVDWRNAEVSKLRQQKIKFQLKGAFPYGVYQNFQLDQEQNEENASMSTLTGIQKKTKWWQIYTFFQHEGIASPAI